jgi:hypothetical protein
VRPHPGRTRVNELRSGLGRTRRSHSKGEDHGEVVVAGMAPGGHPGEDMAIS